MKKILRIILLPIGWVLEWLIRRHDDYNEAFKNGWHY
jgi:hypothetical protein